MINNNMYSSYIGINNAFFTITFVLSNRAKNLTIISLTLTSLKNEENNFLIINTSSESVKVFTQNQYRRCKRGTGTRK